MNAGVRKMLLGACHRTLGLSPRQLKDLPGRYLAHFYPSYSTSDILRVLRSMGLEKGRTLFLHSSWNHFLNYSGKPLELIRALQEELGERGTLAMPAFPAIAPGGDLFFDVARTPSAAGLITEIFRRLPGTQRSINLDHSVCAAGPNADFLLKDHFRSMASCDQHSPYYKLRDVDALIVGLGVGRNLRVATALHCVDSLLRDEIPYFASLYAPPVRYVYRAFDGTTGELEYLPRLGRIDTRKISRFMDRRELVETKLSNLEVYSVSARYLIDRSFELARQGITMFVEPRPHTALFRPRQSEQ